MQKFLLLRIGRAGDMVMLTPAIKSLSQQYPNALIDIITSKDGPRILKGLTPQLNNIVIYNRKSLNVFKENRKILQLIKQQQYDKIYCFEFNQSFKKLLAKSHADVVYIDQVAGKNMNYAELCLRLVLPDFQLSAERQTWVNLPVSAQGKEKAQALLGDIRRKNTIVVGFHPTYSGNKKSLFRLNRVKIHRTWPTQHFAQLAILLKHYALEKGISLAIIMDLLPEEKPIGDAIFTASQKSVVVLTPEPNFSRYLAMLSELDLLVVTNTGPMHMAAAVGTPVIALFSGHHPGDCAPYVSENASIVLRAEETAHPELGVAAITPATVFDACVKFIEQKLVS